MTVRITVQPAFEPVALADMKQWCTVDASDTGWDALLTGLIKAMREYAENLTLRAYVQRQYRMYHDRWPVIPPSPNVVGNIASYGVKIDIPFPPLVSVDSIQYRDLNGDLQTLDPSQYVVHAWREPAIVVPQWNAIWPVIRLVPDAVQVAFTAGYPAGSPGNSESDAQANLPQSLKLWMQARAATLFQNREQLVQGQMFVIPRDFADGLLDSLTLGTRLA